MIEIRGNGSTDLLLTALYGDLEIHKQCARKPNGALHWPAISSVIHTTFSIVVFLFVLTYVRLAQKYPPIGAASSGVRRSKQFSAICVLKVCLL